MGVRRYEIEAYGCSFTNTQTTSPVGSRPPAAQQPQPVRQPGRHDRRAAPDQRLPDQRRRPPGGLGDLHDRGRRRANFAVGNRVLIYGYPQQFTSDPPNARYFEYNQITSIPASPGVIGLKHRLLLRLRRRLGRLVGHDQPQCC